ncbi:MAG TPA: hypothetical protein VFP87_12995 [Chitinophagaceae bacterium]|nr:hypothetical protein [Chitinophagaceae bacterium]
MRKSDFLTACYLSSLVGLLSCGKSNNNACNISYSNAPVTNVQGPNSGLVNQDLSLSVLCTCFNSCGRFERIDENSNADTTKIKLIAKYEGCACLDVLTGVQAIYKFRATRVGTYYLKFWQGENSFLTDTITIR